MKYDLSEYLQMMCDPVRMPAYRAAIRAAVRPGDVVLDLGAGTAVMGFLALDAGARRVFAVDTSAAIGVARAVALANGLADRIACIGADCTRIVLPELADVVVSDVRGTLPIMGDSLRVISDARRRHLKPGGSFIPLEDRIQVAPAECAEAFTAVDRWRAAWGSVDFSSVAAIAANQWTRHPMKPESLLAPAQGMAPLRYTAEPPATLAIAAEFRAERDGAMHGIAAWFDTELTPGVHFSTGPAVPETVYGHAFFPLARPRAVHEGDAIIARLEVRLTAEPVWIWSVTQRGETERHSSFEGALFDLERLHRHAPSARPRLDEEGEIDLFALSLMIEDRSLGEIAREMAARFPRCFARWEDALGRAGALAERYAPPPELRGEGRIP